MPAHDELLQQQRTFFETDQTKNYAFRKAALDKLLAALNRHEPTLLAALKADLGKSETESLVSELGMVRSEIRLHQKMLKRWMRPKHRKTGFSTFPSRAYSLREPFGVTLVMAPWNYPVLLCLDPVIGAISGGNTCVLKPSAYAPAVSHALADMLGDAFPREYIAVVEGGRQENTALMELRWDFIFFTGSINVGKLVMEKASKNLTPILLELGGKSPVIVDRTADLKLAARRIAFGKYLNCGQTCVAPDYLLIDAAVKNAFLAAFADEVRGMYGDHPLENEAYGHIVQPKHWQRLMGLIANDKPYLGGCGDETKLKIEPTVIDGVTIEHPLMQEEIFGPILPVMTYTNFDDAMRLIRSREKPLAAYLFSRDPAHQQMYRQQLSFGGGCINDVVVHLAADMGFGGVGHSGMGNYHGVRSFEAFTHEKNILIRGRFDPSIRYQPYTGRKVGLIRKLMGA